MYNKILFHPTSNAMRNIFLVSHPFFVITVFYTLSYWPILFDSGIQWDDVVYYGVSYEDMLRHTLEFTGGNPFRFYLIYFFVFIDSMHNFLHLIQFILFLLIYYVFFAFCRAMPIFKDRPLEVISVVLLTITAPVFFSRFCLYMLPQEIHVFSFVLAVYFFQRYLYGRAKGLLFFSVIFLFCACDYSSVCPFYYPSLYFIIVQHDADVSSVYADRDRCLVILLIRSVVIAVKKYHLLWIIPIVAFCMNRIIFSPCGDYSGYNNLAPIGLERLISSLENNLFYPLVLLTKIPSLSGTTYDLVALSTLLISAYFFYDTQFSPSDMWRNTRRLAAVSILYIAAIFAYVALGRYNSFYPAYTRDQILIVFVLGLLVFFFIRTFIKGKLLWIPLVMVLATFVATNVTGHIATLKQHAVKDAFALSLASSKKIRQCSTIEIKNFQPLREWGTASIAFYEYGYIFQNTFGQDAYFVYGDDMPSVNLPILKKYKKSKEYHFSQWDDNGRFCKLDVKYAEGKQLSTIQALKYSLGKTFKIGSLINIINGLIELRVEVSNVLGNNG